MLAWLSVRKLGTPEMKLPFNVRSIDTVLMNDVDIEDSKKPLDRISRVGSVMHGFPREDDATRRDVISANRLRRKRAVLITQATRCDGR